MSERTDERNLQRWRDRMMREARAAAGLNHPNLVAVHDVGESGGSPYIVMEYVEGKTLRALIGRIDRQDGVRWLGEVAAALSVAHQRGLVHRDVKPDNVIIRGDGIAKLADFGVARVGQSEVDPSGATVAQGLATLTEEGAAVGTPMYMTPEQLRAEPVDGRTDQFGWAVTAYEVLSGQSPWNATSPTSLLSAILVAELLALCRVNTAIPGELSSVVERAMAKAPGDRFDSMADVVNALRPLQEVKPGVLPTGDESLRVAIGESVDGQPSVERPTWWTIPTVVAVLAGVVALIYLAWPNGVSAIDEPVAAPGRASTRSTSSAAGTNPLPKLGETFFPCEEQDAGGWKRCGDGAKAWCDRKDQVVACCASPSVAVSREGYCACPPGGVTERQDASGSGCPPAKKAGDGKAIQSVVRSKFGQLKKCYEKALASNPKATGKFSVYFQLDPQGLVHRATIKYVSLPDPEFQACVLEIFRNMRFPPPRGGWETVAYPITFTPGG